MKTDIFCMFDTLMFIYLTHSTVFNIIRDSYEPLRTFFEMIRNAYRLIDVTLNGMLLNRVCKQACVGLHVDLALITLHSIICSSLGRS